MLLLLLISTFTLVVADVSHFEGPGQEPVPTAFAYPAGIYPGHADKQGTKLDDNGFITEADAWGSRSVGAGAVIEQGVMHHPTAQIGGGAVLQSNCIIGAHAVVGGGAVIGRGAIIGPGARCEGGAVMGQNSILGPNARLGGGQVLPANQVRL